MITTLNVGNTIINMLINFNFSLRIKISNILRFYLFSMYTVLCLYLCLQTRREHQISLHHMVA